MKANSRALLSGNEISELIGGCEQVRVVLVVN